MPTYRVTFIHARHRTRFEVELVGPTPEDARMDAAFLLNEKLADSAGHLDDWHEGSTVEVPTKDLTTGDGGGRVRP